MKIARVRFYKTWTFNLKGAALALLFLLMPGVVFSVIKPPVRITEGIKKLEVLPPEFHAIGRLRANVDGTVMRCTAILVAKNIILTARHCLSNEEETKMTSTAIFQPAFSYFPYAEVRAVLLEYEEGIRDWALLRLDSALDIDPLPIYWPKKNEHLLTLSPEKVMAIGYSDTIESGNVLSYDTNCTAIDSVMYSIDTTCQFHHGASGGPFLAWVKDKWMIVGVIRAAAKRWPPPDLDNAIYYNSVTTVYRAKAKILKYLSL